MSWNPKKPSLAWAALAAAALASSSLAQEGMVTPNYRNTDLEVVVEAVGQATGKTFILDPRIDVSGGVTLIASQPMTTAAYYQAFLSMLTTHGIVAAPSGAVVKLLPDRNLRIIAGFPPGEMVSEELETRVLAVVHVNAQSLVPILRPMLSPGAHLSAHASSNLLIVSDRGANVTQVARIVRRIDRQNNQPIEVIALEHASARDIARVLSEITAGSGLSTGLAVADDRTNSILLGGETSRRVELRALVAHLDTPLVEGGNTRVRYLSYATAESLAEKLARQFADDGNAENKVQVSADGDTNALIIDAPPETLRRILSVVDQLDIRRAQVLVEALIVEVSADQASQLGVNWAAYDPKRVLGSTEFPASGTSLRELVAGSLSDSNEGRAVAARALGPGAGFAIGRVRDDGLSFAALISAVENTAGANILGTPMLVTLDNQEASIDVGQEVPFVTGSYASAGVNPSSADGQIRPFTTVNRSQVGLKLTITPRINEGDAVRLEISQELSELAASVAGAVDLVTNRRVLKTAVIVEDGGTLVLGGLIQEKIRESRQSVPLLGRLPLIGALFRSSSVTREKTNLMLFIRPTILRDSAQGAAATNVKYNYLRRQQLIRSYSGGGPLLPELEDVFEPPEGPAAPNEEGEAAPQERETATPD